MDVSREQVIAFRIAAQGLHRGAGGDGVDAVLDLGLQESGPTAAVALAARLAAPGDVAGVLAGTVTAWTHRGAPHRHRPGDLARWAAANRPVTDDDAAARLSWSGPERTRIGVPALAAIDRTAEALARVVDRPHTKGEASAGVTALLPESLLRDCRPCGATHVNEQLMRLAGAAAGIGLDTDGPALMLLPPPAGWTPTPEPDPTLLVDRFLRVLGPGTAAHVAGFAGTSVRAAPVWTAAHEELELVDVRVDGVSAAVRGDDLAALENPPDPDLVRLLPPFDPLLQARDRELQVPDADRRAELFRPIGNPGAVLADGEIVGTWRPRATGRRLSLVVRAFAPWPPDVRARVDEEAERVAAVRGLRLAGVVSG